MGILEQINQSKPIYYSNHLTKEMFENGSLETLKNISKDTFENIIINLRSDYYADIIVLK